MIVESDSALSFQTASSEVAGPPPGRAPPREVATLHQTHRGWKDSLCAPAEHEGL